MSIKLHHGLVQISLLMLLTCSCSSNINPAQTAATISTSLSTVTPANAATRVPDGLLLRETERVGTVFALQTASTTPFPTPVPTRTSTPEPTSTPKPPSTNDVLISYIVYAGDGVDEITSCINSYFSYRFVLYRDGHLILFDETRYLETRINQTEIDKLLSKIEATGLSSIAGDGDQYQQNMPTPSFVGGWGSSITVEGKTMGMSSAPSTYLAAPVTKTLDIITKYKPQNLQPYIPESVILWVFTSQGIELGIADPTPTPPLLKWPIAQINLDDLVTKNFTDMPPVISGTGLQFILQQVHNIPALRRVEQNGQDYLVAICPNFP